MGSLDTNTGAIAAFTGSIFPNGLDLGRCIIQQDLGIFVADPNASFKQGQLLTKTAAGFAQCAGTPVIGVAKWNKTLTLSGVNVDEQIVLTGTTASALKKGNVTNVKVTSLDGVTTYTVTTDYTVSAANGTVTRNGAGAILSGATVKVTYTYDLASADLDFEGRNFHNSVDDVGTADNRITVICDWSVLFTTQYDTSRAYTLGDNLYCAGGVTAAKAGLFTNNVAEGDKVGRLIQLPSATDPFMGIMFSGGPT